LVYLRPVPETPSHSNQRLYLKMKSYATKVAEGVGRDPKSSPWLVARDESLYFPRYTTRYTTTSAQGKLQSKHSPLSREAVAAVVVGRRSIGAHLEATPVNCYRRGVLRIQSSYMSNA
jgi:hypothetical protein